MLHICNPAFVILYEVFNISAWLRQASDPYAIERMAILTPGNRITIESLPMEIRFPPSSAPSGLQETRDAAERDRIVQALGQTDWNVSGAARLLGIERTNLHKRIRALGLSREK